MIPFIGDLCHKSPIRTIFNPYINPGDRWASSHAINEDIGSPEKLGYLTKATKLARVRAGIPIQAFGQQHSQITG